MIKDKIFVKFLKHFFDNLQIINSEIHLEKNAKLSDYAELIFPKNLKSYKDSKDMNARVITAKTYSKVFKFSDIDTTWRTNTVLKKNDILINSENYIYLHEEEYKTPVYVSPINQLVIRAKEDVNIKALYCILKLDNDLLFDNITSDMPVIAVKEDNNYDEIFAVLTGKKHEYEADLLDENLEQALRSCVLQQMQDVIKSDLKEIERCYSGNAYKAAIVLCGSVLEAFLYDWLKEGNIQIKENWDLKEYITQIENACWPKWEIGAKKATDIRKSRNLIHPEKYVKDFSKIDQKLCDDIIKALDYVTKTRSKIKFNN